MVREEEHDNTDAWKDESRDKRKDERKDEWGRNGKDNPVPSAPQQAVAQRATSCVPGSGEGDEDQLVATPGAP